MKPTVGKFKKQIPLLEFENVTVIKGDNKILDSISLKIYQNENVAILGPNGSGKSSLIKTITREYYPVQQKKGFTFKIWGEERWNIFDLRFLLGIVSSDLQYTFVREVSGLEVVLSGFFSSIGLFRNKITPAMRKKAQRVIEFLEIGHLKKRTMNALSSGEARRFLIARALIHDPKALILDEPTNSLDLHALYKFREILRKITKTGTRIILVTHHLQDIIPEINRVILLDKGKIQKDGSKESILTNHHFKKLFKIPLSLKIENGYYHAVGY